MSVFVYVVSDEIEQIALWDAGIDFKEHITGHSVCLALAETVINEAQSGSAKVS